jgi:hypothetical protein
MLQIIFGLNTTYMVVDNLWMYLWCKYCNVFLGTYWNIQAFNVHIIGNTIEG